MRRQVDEIIVRKKTIKKKKVDRSPWGSGSINRIRLFNLKYGCPQYTKATEFLVIDNLSCSPSGDWALGKLTGGTEIYIGLKINSTEYHISPNGDWSPGVPGLASPYPDGDLANRFIDVDPSVYILPGQSWEVLLSFRKIRFEKDNPEKNIRGFVSYVLYDGADALIANKLLSMGVTVAPENVDWYKRKILEKEESILVETIDDCWRVGPSKSKPKEPELKKPTRHRTRFKGKKSKMNYIGKMTPVKK